mgnify:FL=1
MSIKNLGEIEAIAFDIDGTLYPQNSIHWRAIFHYIIHNYFFLHYGIVRSKLHKMNRLEDLNDTQAELMAKGLLCSKEVAKEKLRKIVYDGLKKYFKRIKCYDNVPETFEKFKNAGFKLALLSDFPPEQKGEIWGVKKYCDVVLGTEQLGALKPDPYSFLEMAKMLNVEPSKILYVGNSKKYDVEGSHNAGMKCAYLVPFRKRLFKKFIKEPEICFSNYRQLQDIVLQ